MDIYDEIRAERERQDAQWGGPDHDDEHGVNDWEGLIGDYIQLALEARMRTGNHDLTGWRTRMLQAAALAVAAIQSTDRGNGVYPRTGVPR